jgi:hypothetical protein
MRVLQRKPFQQGGFAMPTSLPLSTDRPAKVTHPLGYGLLALCVLAVICAALVVFGPQIRAAKEAELARIVDEEDRTFCAKFGAGPETSRYGECSAALKGIRTRHEERIMADAAGIL